MSSKIVRSFRWLFGIVFALAGIGYLFSHVLAGIICLLIAAILIPPVIMFIQRQFKTIFPRKYKIIALIVLFILLIIAVPRTSTDNIDFKNIDTKIPQSEQIKNGNQQASPETSKIEAPKVVEASTVSTSETTPSDQPKTPAPAVAQAPAPTPPPAPTSAPPAAKSECDPNYSGCVPIASDVDCANGSGDGPAYVTGPIKVIGSDHYRLDGDHDGIACDK